MDTITAVTATESTQDQPSKVLIVEDEQALRLLYSEILKTAGFQTVLAASGHEALDALTAHHGDDELAVIVSDISMPGMDGMQLLRAVRERGLHTPMIVVTGNPSIDSAARAVEYGAMRYLVKPVVHTELIDLVTRAVRLHRIAVLKQQAATHLGITAVEAGDRIGLENRLLRGIDALWMAYQPIVNPVRREIFAFEALVRTREVSIPHPGVLFSIAERLGCVPQVGRIIREHIAKLLAEKQPEADIFINLHPHDLLEDDLYSSDSLLAPFACQIVLEITERAALDQIADIPERMHTLRRLGFRIAIDDLGAGYSGLNHLALLSPDIVKLDRLLFISIDQDPVKQKIVGAISSLCKEMGVLTVAEGIESAADAATAQKLGCDLLQGYFFARPGPAFPEVKWMGRHLHSVDRRVNSRSLNQSAQR